MQNNWLNEIANGVKSFFGMAHDASEQEVHQQLYEQKNIETMRAELRTEIEAEVKAAGSDEFFKEKTALETSLAEAESQAADLQKQVDALTGEATRLRDDSSKKADEIAQLKTDLAKKPAAAHSGGETDDETNAAEPWKNTAINQKATRLRAVKK